MCLAQGHNAVTPVRLEHTALWPGVKHFTTEPLHSPMGMFVNVAYSILNELAFAIELYLDTSAGRMCTCS